MPWRWNSGLQGRRQPRAWRGSSLRRPAGSCCRPSSCCCPRSRATATAWCPGFSTSVSAGSTDRRSIGPWPSSSRTAWCSVVAEHHTPGQHDGLLGDASGRAGAAGLDGGGPGGTRTPRRGHPPLPGNRHGRRRAGRGGGGVGARPRRRLVGGVHDLHVAPAPDAPRQPTPDGTAHRPDRGPGPAADGSEPVVGRFGPGPGAVGGPDRRPFDRRAHLLRAPSASRARCTRPWSTVR